MKHPKHLEEFLILNDHKWAAMFGDPFGNLESEVLMSISKPSNKLRHGLRLSRLRRFTFMNVTFKIARRVIFGPARLRDRGVADPHVRGASNELTHIHTVCMQMCRPAVHLYVLSHHSALRSLLV